MIQVFRPVFHVEECLAQLREVLELGWAGLGPKTAEFERRLAALVGANHFVATSSCTAAIQLALKVLDLRRGARVLTSPITFVSAWQTILHAGHEPVFCDVEPRTGNLNAAHLWTISKPAAVMATHIGGYPCDVAAIRALGIPVIWDCAHALGSSFRPEGDLACWSFHAVKNLPMGDGGGVSTDDPDLAARLRRLRWCGIDKSTADSTGEGYVPRYEVTELGYKAHMNDVASAIGLAELDFFAEGQARRRAIAGRYLSEIDAEHHPEYLAGRVSSFHFLPLFFDCRDSLAETLRAVGIFPGMHYRRYDRTGGLKGAEWYEEHELTLPLHLAMTDDDVTRVIEMVNRTLRGWANPSMVSVA